MDPIIVMVGRVNDVVQDIEVMPDIKAEELAEAIAAAFRWEGTYDIEIGGKILANQQTLAEVNAWDGSELTLVVSKRLAHVGNPQNGAHYTSLQVKRLDTLEDSSEEPSTHPKDTDSANLHPNKKRTKHNATQAGHSYQNPVATDNQS